MLNEKALINKKYIRVAQSTKNVYVRPGGLYYLREFYFLDHHLNTLQNTLDYKLNTLQTTIDFLDHLK